MRVRLTGDGEADDAEYTAEKRSFRLRCPRLGLEAPGRLAGGGGGQEMSGGRCGMQGTE
jgi:hypothetical protein